MHFYNLIYLIFLESTHLLLVPIFWRFKSELKEVRHPWVTDPVNVYQVVVPIKYIAKRAVGLAEICRDLQPGLGLKGKSI